MVWVEEDNEDDCCRLLAIRPLEGDSGQGDEDSSGPLDSRVIRREKEKQRASRRRGAMRRASSVPRARVSITIN